MMRIILLLLLLVPPLPLLAAPPNVLVLHSYHPGLSWTDTLNTGIRETFRAEMPEALLWVEYLDTKRNTDTSYLSLQAALLRHKLAESTFNLIITTDNDALDFVLEYRDDIFRGAPVVFCGVNDFAPGQLGGQKDITGLAENPAFTETMLAALALNPGTKEFVIIGADQAITDLLTDRSLRALEQQFPAIRFTYWNNLDARELRTRLKELGPGQIILVHGVMRNEEGVLVDYRGKNLFLSTHAGVPIYGFWDFEMGTGCVGGKMVQGQTEGERVARLAINVLGGADPGGIPVNTQTPSRYIFDYIQLQRFGISEKALPKDSLVLNQPARFYQIDKRYIWTATAGVAVLLAALAMLVSAIRRRQEAQAVLRRHKEQLEEAVRARTEHLRTANDELEREVHERIRAEGDLRKARASLEIEVDRRTRDLRFEIEQRRLAEAHIRDREAKARALINAPTETLLLMDQAGIILDINETGASRLGRNRESLYGLSLYALLPETRAERFRQTVDNVFSTGEVRSINEYGEERDLDLRFYPVFDDGGQVTRVAVFMADVTGARRMARQIMLLDKINSLGRMAAGIAHEIRNPLTGIHGYLYAMDEICDELPTEPASVLRTTIAKIRKAAGKMESVIRRVLDFSKPGTPQLELLDLAVPVQEGLSLMLPTLRKAGITVDTEFSPVPAILGDRMQLEQAVINIVDNAARAVRNNAETKNIALRIVCEADRLSLCIADNGPGITPADRERIFDPFYTTASDGTGIGLSIVQRIVADHSGTIHVGESPAGGAEFRLEFPLPATEHQ
ncbi:ATP-binding protein [Desulfomicrobium sp. ZS1]|uniref:ATP-binding protein n=1 Tax=Desulfomicrobium sp. ZS1 TaxID=2952228 RepID=UPI0020B38577|nr:ATP-binding protein [Desulfomicrobium sp. ZS1]UTF48762.1 ATP-binding protein [Desulfomicrobium sp. ZS1]